MENKLESCSPVQISSSVPLCRRELVAVGEGGLNGDLLILEEVQQPPEVETTPITTCFPKAMERVMEACILRSAMLVQLFSSKPLKKKRDIFVWIQIKEKKNVWWHLDEDDWILFCIKALVYNKSHIRGHMWRRRCSKIRNVAFVLFEKRL